ncbi:MAG: hypothetical protein JXA44_12430 [Methanospirillaceae archaeon]|nr:hypothetical protein [Methanospirillaceae archaeon]
MIQSNGYCVTIPVILLPGFILRYLSVMVRVCGSLRKCAQDRGGSSSPPFLFIIPLFQVIL